MTHKAFETKARTREEAESILWQPVQRDWQRSETVSGKEVVDKKFSDYDATLFHQTVQERSAKSVSPAPLAEPPPTIINPIQSPFASYVKPGERVNMPAPAAPPAPVDWDSVAALEKIAEVEVAQLKIAEPKQQQTQNESAKYKLNARGWIAIAAFISVVVLVTALIIINASNIGIASSRISTLRDENAVLSASVSQAEYQRDTTYDRITNDIRTQLNNQIGEYRYLTANGTTGEFTQLPPTAQVPPTNTIRPPLGNPDASTNWFDRLSRWLSGLFR